MVKKSSFQVLRAAGIATALLVTAQIWAQSSNSTTTLPKAPNAGPSIEPSTEAKNAVIPAEETESKTITTTIPAPANPINTAAPAATATTPVETPAASSAPAAVPSPVSAATVAPAAATPPPVIVEGLPPAETSEVVKKPTKYDPEHPYNKDFQTVDKAIKNKEFKDDHKLTDIRLRASDGSLSRYSINSSFSITGPRVGNLQDPTTPNPDQKVGNHAQTLRGNISARYRLDSDHSIGFGSGISFNHPLQGIDRTDTSNPFISYNIANRIGGVQIISSPGISYATVPEFVNVGQVGAANIQNSIVKGLGDSKFAVSLDVNASYFAYNRGYVPGPSKPANYNANKRQQKDAGSAAANTTWGDGKVTQFTISAGPGLKYNISDHMNIYTSIEMSYYNPRSSSDSSVLWNSTPSARLGMGYAYDRNIFIAPYIQTYPTAMTLDMTTINVATIFSLL